MPARPGGTYEAKKTHDGTSRAARDNKAVLDAIQAARWPLVQAREAEQEPTRRAEAERLQRQAEQLAKAEAEAIETACPEVEPGLTTPRPAALAPSPEGFMAKLARKRAAWRASRR